MSESTSKPRSVLPVAAGFEASLAVVAIVLGALLGVDPLATLNGDVRAVGWGLLAAAPLFLVLWLIVRIPARPFRELVELVDHFLAEALRGATLRHFALISLMAGIGEETLFRGLAQPLLGDLIGSRFAGLIAASILFGLAHSVTPAYAILATAVGVYLGLLWIVTENLLAPIVAHGAYDFFALWYLKSTAPRRRPERRASDAE
jgi:membrane protease YdiL (CAAX protease family)